MPPRAVPTRDYLKSQAMLELPHQPAPAAASLVRSLLSGDSLLERERLGGALLEVLNGSFNLPDCRLVVADRAQLHATDSSGRLERKTYGYYRCRIPAPGATPERCAIRIYHRTAVRQQVLAPGAFVTTLLHEWTHHFDFAGLKLSRSPHTGGFYSRLRWLTTSLGPAPGPSDPRHGAVAGT